MRNVMCRILACMIVLTIIPAGLCIFAFCLPAQYGETFLGELPYKCDLLENTEGRRIVIVGGSGVAFGLRSDLLEKELPDYQVVNFGMYAGLGSTVMLDLAAPRLRKGDIVIFSPEQSTQTLSPYLNAEAMWQAVDGRFDLLCGLGGEDWEAMLGQFPFFAAKKANYCRNNNAPIGEGVYARTSFNRWGDVDYAGRTGNQMPGGMDHNMPIRFDSQMVSQAFIQEVNAFAALCQKKGAVLFYRFCPMNAAAIESVERTCAKGYQEWLAGQLDFPVLGDIEDAILDSAWFYDTNFHLNSAGAVWNTACLAAELKDVLGIPGQVNIILPEPPAPLKSFTLDGNDADADCFRYLAGDGGLRIVGLTTVGATKERIIVPTHYGGEAVIALDPLAFEGNTTVREVVLQANIQGVEDRSFFGCTSLERLVVQNPLPSSCPVGRGLLDGTAAMVYVPAECYSDYQTNYSWSVHASRLVPMDSAGQRLEPEGKKQASTPSEIGPCLRYDANGGTTLDGAILQTPLSKVHLRTNTALGQNMFTREGYVLIGWNTKPDGTGTAVGFGSRTKGMDDGILYAQWSKAAPETDFAYTVKDGKANVTRYFGERTVCAVPETLGGYVVHSICDGAFAGSPVDTVILPPGLFRIEKGAFADCAVRELYLYDSLYYVYDESFEGCKNLSTLHINANTRPVYSGSYYDTFSDKYDRLLSLKGRQKIVLFSGSATRYAYDCEIIRCTFPAYEPVNMGVYAYTNALPQYMLILDCMEAGDILISAPEFDTVKTQFCTSNELDTHLWAMTESNYDVVSRLDLRVYDHVFDSLREYLTARSVMASRDYEINPKHFDDDGNAYKDDTYNIYGDFIMQRSGSEQDELLQTYLARYTVEAFPVETIQHLNQVYEHFLRKGINVYFSYAPRNRSALSQDSTPEARAVLDTHLRRQLTVPVLLDMEETLYPGTYFYLIDNHLSTEGVNLYMKHFISAMQKRLFIMD